MFTRMLDRIETALALVGDSRRWFLIGLAVPATVAAWWLTR